MFESFGLGHNIIPKLNSDVINFYFIAIFALETNKKGGGSYLAPNGFIVKIARYQF